MKRERKIDPNELVNCKQLIRCVYELKKKQTKTVSVPNHLIQGNWISFIFIEHVSSKIPLSFYKTGTEWHILLLQTGLALLVGIRVGNGDFLGRDEV